MFPFQAIIMSMEKFTNIKKKPGNFNYIAFSSSNEKYLLFWEADMAV